MSRKNQNGQSHSDSLEPISENDWEDITCVTCTTIRDTCLCLDSSYSPLRDVIVWLDKRKAACCNSIPLVNRILFRLVGMKEAVKLQREVSYCNWIEENQKEIIIHNRIIFKIHSKIPPLGGRGQFYYFLNKFASFQQAVTSRLTR